MAATLLLGNPALLTDATSSRAAMAYDRAAAKSWHPELSMSRLPRREPAAAAAPLAAHAMAFHEPADAGGDPAAAPMMARRRRRGASSMVTSAPRMAHSWRMGTSSKVSAAGDSLGSGGDGEDDDEDDDWEENLKSHLKEIEEMKELEKRAAELVAEGAGGDEETEEEKRERVRRELEKFTKELSERRKTAKLMFELGQKAYGKGRYSRAIEFLEAALTIIPGSTLLGGEIQIWLAMSYEANNRHKDCIALYQQLEKEHPVISIRSKAAELRYIMQAPKIKITEDEMFFTIPVMSNYDRYETYWTGKYKNLPTKTNPVPPPRNYWRDFLAWRSPTGLAKNRTFWLIVTLWIGLLGAAYVLQS